MKKQLLFVSAIAFAGVMNAQVTITAADQPTPLQVYQQANDTTMTQSPGNGGTGQTYNFSALLDQSRDSMTFTLPQWTPYGSSYPQSNMAIIINTGDAYIYGNFSATEFVVDGQAFDPAGNGVVPLVFTNPETQMIFPAAYGSSFADTAGGTNQFYLGYDPGVGFTIDTVRIHTTIYKTSDYDGTGSLTSPLGTYNVLRQNTYRKQIDTIDIYAFGNWAPNFFSQTDSARTYSYWTNGIGMPLVELTDQDDIGAITRCTWLPAAPTLTGIPVNEPAETINTYPNPASDVVTFLTPGAEGTLEIIDMTGRVVMTVNITDAQTTISVSELANGMYTYRVTAQSVATGKIQVQH